MRIFIVPLVGLGVVLASSASAAPVFPNGAKALETQLLAAESAEAHAWIKDEAAREVSTRIVSEETPRNAARKFGATGSDVSKLAFLVMMEAARAADNNVSELVNGVQSAGASRQDIRQQVMVNNAMSGAQQQQKSGGEQTAEQAQGQAFLSLLPEDPGDNPIAQARAPQAVPAPTMTLQDAMDRENQIDDLLDQAMKNVAQPG